MTMKVQVNEFTHGVRAVVLSCVGGTSAAQSLSSFPFDGSRGFGADIIDHSVDSRDLVDNPVGDPP